MIGIVFALGFEAKNFKKTFSHSKIKYCILNVTGVRIAEEVDFLIRKNNIQCIVLMGFAGGMNDSLRVGDVVLAKNYTSAQFLPHFEACAGNPCRKGALPTRISRGLLRYGERPCLEYSSKIIDSDDHGSIHQ